MYSEIVKKLHDKGLAYNELLNQIREINETVILKSEKLLDMLKELGESTLKKHPNLCSVCIERDSTHCFLPCGHGGYCNRCCMLGQRRNRCFACRGSITGLLRVFL